MLRIVRGPEQVKFDPSARAPGRGAYVHADPDCWALAVDGSLEHALRVKLSEEERQKLDKEMKKIFDEQNG